MTIEFEGNTYLSPKEFSERYSWPTRASLRWHIHQNTDHFRDKCIRKRGRRVWISEKDFQEWLSGQEQKGAENYA